MQLSWQGLSRVLNVRHASLVILVADVACNPTPASYNRPDSTKPASSTIGNGDTSHLLVAGDSLRLIEHPENLPAGFPLQIKPLPVRNPYEGDKTAVASGAQLFIGYNCLDCHGADGSGAMGP